MLAGVEDLAMVRVRGRKFGGKDLCDTLVIPSVKETKNKASFCYRAGDENVG